MKKNIFIILILSLALIGSVNAAIPPNPTNLNSDTSQSGHVVWSWSAGALGNVTDSYNVSVTFPEHIEWVNGSSSTSYDHYIGVAELSTIVVWAYNNTANASLSTGNVTGSQRAHLTFSSITGVIEDIIPLFASLIDLVIAIVPLTIVMIVVAGLAILINKAFSKVMK